MNYSGDRGEIYHDLHNRQLSVVREENARSAKRFFEIAAEYFEFKSVLDVGCGLGTWLMVAKGMGKEIAGIEGPWLELDKLDVDKEAVTITDLEQPIELGRRFDLAISLEVGEHLSQAAAPHLVQTLTAHADHVIFSAAVPFQGGHHHVNEQYLDFWIEVFQARGFIPVDIFRGKLWEDESVHWWLRQNGVLFATREAVERNPKLKAESEVCRPLSIIHPINYQRRVTFVLNEMIKIHQSLRLLYEGKASLRDTPGGIVIHRHREH